MKTLPELATNLMKEWYEAHCDKPYPTESERQELARLGQITESQVKAWFANKRNRTFNTRSKINRINRIKLLPKKDGLSNQSESKIKSSQPHINYMNNFFHHPFVINPTSVASASFLPQAHLNLIKDPIIFYPTPILETSKILKPRKSNLKPKLECNENAKEDEKNLENVCRNPVEHNSFSHSKQIQYNPNNFPTKNQYNQKHTSNQTDQSNISQPNDYTNQFLSLINNNNSIPISTSTQPSTSNQMQIIGSFNLEEEKLVKRHLIQNFQQQQLLLQLNTKRNNFYSNQTQSFIRPQFQTFDTNNLNLNEYSFNKNFNNCENNSAQIFLNQNTFITNNEKQQERFNQNQLNEVQIKEWLSNNYVKNPSINVTKTKLNLKPKTYTPETDNSLEEASNTNGLKVLGEMKEDLRVDPSQNLSNNRIFDSKPPEQIENVAQKPISFKCSVSKFLPLENNIDKNLKESSTIPKEHISDISLTNSSSRRILRQVKKKTMQTAANTANFQPLIQPRPPGMARNQLQSNPPSFTKSNDYTNQLLSLINSNNLAINSQPNAQLISSLDESKLINRQIIKNLQQHFQQQQLFLELNSKSNSLYNSQTNFIKSPKFQSFNNFNTTENQYSFSQNINNNVDINNNKKNNNDTTGNSSYGVSKNNHESQYFSSYELHNSDSQFQPQLSKICYDSCCYINTSPTSSNSSYQLSPKANIHPSNSNYSSPPASISTNTSNSCIINNIDNNECNIFECGFCQEKSLNLEQSSNNQMNLNSQTCLSSSNCSHNSSWSSLWLSSNVQQCDTPPPIITNSSFNNSIICNNNDTNQSSPVLINHFKSDKELCSSSKFSHLHQSINENLDVSPRSTNNESPLTSFYSQKFSCFNQNNSKILNNGKKLNQFSPDDSESNRFKFKCSLKNRYFQNK